MQNTPKEWSHLRRIKSLVQRHNPNTVVPLGDDAFVFKNFPGLSVIAQDMMIEDVHFHSRNSTPADLGHKALAVNLSDLAAMGAQPHFAQVSLALPRHLTESWLDEFYQGMTKLGDKWNVEIVGGDLCASPQHIVIAVSVYGSCQKPLTRQNVQAGDLLLCSGPLGLSQTGFSALENNLENFAVAKERHLRPTPRLDLVGSLQEHSEKVHALMDCSDGLINDALILSPEKVGFQVFAENIPLHTETNKLAQSLSKPALDFALWGGEDYELLLAISPDDHKYYSNWHTVGQFTSSPGFYILHADAKVEIKEFKGWQHFK